jgi:ABC-type sugar transport system substrate-binding protein
MNRATNAWKLSSLCKLLSAAGVAAAVITGCDSGATTHTVPVATTPPNATIDFTVFATQAFSNSANSTPVAINKLSFNFDSNDDPTAFDALIAEGSF